MSDAATILYDLPSKGHCACWSLNSWKTRLALNYKNIDYKTEWVEYPDIAPTLKAFGIPPNATGIPYTIPAIRLNGTYYQDSRPIAAHIEQLYPSPSLHLDSLILSKLEALMPKIMLSMAPVVMPRIPRNILNGRSVKYFHETRSKRFGMPLDEFEKSETGGETAWENVRPVLEEVASLLKANGGPFS